MIYRVILSVILFLLLNIYSFKEITNKLTNIGLEVENIKEGSGDLNAFKIAKILKAEKSNTNGKAGSIISENFEVCCGEGSIKVLSIQREGKRVQQINEFLLGTQIKKGFNIA